MKQKYCSLTELTSLAGEEPWERRYLGGSIPVRAVRPPHNMLFCYGSADFTNIHESGSVVAGWDVLRWDEKDRPNCYNVYHFYAVSTGDGKGFKIEEMKKSKLRY